MFKEVAPNSWLIRVCVAFLLCLVSSKSVYSQTDTIPSRDDNMAMGNPSSATTSASDTNNYLVVKPQYTLSYSNVKGMANWVSWHLSSAWKGSAPRCDCFTQDATLPSGYFRASSSDYTSTGFDRGHLCPSDDRDGSDTDNAATFKMSNIAPQSPILNQQIWGNLEDYCRVLVSEGNELYIIAGGYGSGGNGSLGGTTTAIGAGNINVPSHYWKIIVVLPVGVADTSRVTTTTRVIAVDMPNSQSVNAHAWDYYRVSVDTIEARTGFDFLSVIADSIENIVEAEIDNGSSGIMQWDFTGVNNVSSMSATYANDYLDTSSVLSLNVLTRGAGAPASAGVSSFRSTGFMNNGISVTNTDYYQVKLSAKDGYVLSLSGFQARFDGTSSFYSVPGVTSQFAYSFDGVSFTLIGSPYSSTSLNPPTFDCSFVSDLQNIPSDTTVYIRYYASGQTTTGGWGFGSSYSGALGLIINGVFTSYGCGATLTGGNIASTSPEICTGTRDTLSLIGASSGTAITYQWQQSTTSAGVFSNIIGATNDIYITSVLTDTTYYKCITTCSISSLFAESLVTAVSVISGVPDAGTISGDFTLVGSSTSLLTSSGVGGVWSSSAPSIASINVGGYVTPISAGTTIISYVVANACGSSFDTAIVSVSGIIPAFSVVTDSVWTGASGPSPVGNSNFSSVPGATSSGSSIVTVSQWARSGISGSDGSGIYNSSDWSENTSLSEAQSDGKFIYFVISNNANTEVKLSRLTIVGKRSPTGPGFLQVVHRPVGGGEDLPFGNALNPPFTTGDIVFNGNLCIAPGQADTIKVYGWYMCHCGGTFRVENGTRITASYTTGISALSAGIVSNSGPVCAGLSVSLTGGTAAGGVAPYNYNWIGPAGFNSTTQHTIIGAPGTSSAGNYIYTVTDSFGCTVQSTTTLIVNDCGG